MKQLSFNLPTKENSDPYSQEDFLAFDENSGALNFLKKFFSQKKFSQAQFTSILLRGASNSGKTHLLNIFSKDSTKNSQAEFLQIESLSSHNLSTYFVANQFYILENINKIKDEELLLHVINAASEAGAFLVLSTQERINFKLKDLTSRLKNIFPVEIRNPSQEAIKMLLTNAFSRRQLKVPGRIIDAVNDNIERTYDAVFDAVRLVEFYRQENGKNITTKEVRRIFADLSSR